MYRLIRPLLFRLQPEVAQSVAISAARLFGPLATGFGSTEVARGPVSFLGLQFRNRVGLAAGFDKSAEHIDVLGRCGFGFIEVGTLTPRPQPGNPRPRLFRLVEDQALINRMGFNNDGAEAAARRLETRRYTGVCGVNIGKNATTPLADAAKDYVSCLRTLYRVADYVTINLSSPNTAGLRELQAPERIRPLISAIADEREKLQSVHGKRLPMLVKIAPDMSEDQLDLLTAELRELPIEGVIATNTTTLRPASLRSAHAAEVGGLSGEPLRTESLRTLRALRSRLGRDFPIIGVGGISSVEHAQAVRDAGADLIQLYTGFVYQGPSLVRDLVRNLR